jgi:hypothetical protein
MKWSFMFSVVLLLPGGLPALADDAADAQATREKAFSEMLSNTTLEGSFTVDGKMDGPPKAERYEIESVTKLTGNLWTFMVRIKYGKVDSRLPVTVPVVWAEDTPMVALTNASIPGLGDEFSARVIFHDNRYAGTWQHGKAGGHMFGVLEKTKPKAATNKKPE